MNQEIRHIDTICYPDTHPSINKNRYLLLASDPLEPSVIEETITAHQQFLENDYGGLWQSLLIDEDMIMSVYYPGGGNETANQAKFSRKDLTRGEFREKKIRSADCTSVIAPMVDFSDSDFSYSMATYSLFVKADFSNADLRNTDFSRSIMHHCLFRGADLSGADFESCDLRGSDFTGAVLSGTKFPNAYLDDCIGLPEPKSIESLFEGEPFSLPAVLGDLRLGMSFEEAEAAHPEFWEKNYGWSLDLLGYPAGTVLSMDLSYERVDTIFMTVPAEFEERLVSFLSEKSGTPQKIIPAMDCYHRMYYWKNPEKEFLMEMVVPADSDQVSVNFSRFRPLESLITSTEPMLPDAVGTMAVIGRSPSEVRAENPLFSEYGSISFKKMLNSTADLSSTCTYREYDDEDEYDDDDDGIITELALEAWSHEGMLSLLTNLWGKPSCSESGTPYWENGSLPYRENGQEKQGLRFSFYPADNDHWKDSLKITPIAPLNIIFPDNSSEDETVPENRQVMSITEIIHEAELFFNALAKKPEISEAVLSKQTGASEEQIAEFEKVTGWELRPEIREFFQSGLHHFYVKHGENSSGRWYHSLQSITESYEWWKNDASDHQTDLECAEDPDYSEKEREGYKLRIREFSHGICFTLDQFYVVDLETGMVSHQHQYDKSDAAAPSLSEYLMHFIGCGCYDNGWEPELFSEYWNVIKDIVPFGIAPRDNIYLQHVERWCGCSLSLESLS